MTMNFFRIFGVNVRLRKPFEILNELLRASKRHRDNLAKISKIFLRRILIPKILKKFMVIHGKKNTFLWFFSEFFGSICAREKIKGEKLVFEVRKRILAPKVLKRIIEVYFFTISDHAFFQDFGVNVRLRKISEPNKK